MGAVVACFKVSFWNLPGETEIKETQSKFESPGGD
jgi:hypothetical protein